MVDVREFEDLPAGFEALAPFAEEWGDLYTADERYVRRQELPMERHRAFYDAVAPVLPAVFAHLDTFSFEKPLPPAEALLFRIVMGMTEVAQAVEVYGEPGVPNAPEGHQVLIRAVSAA